VPAGAPEDNQSAFQGCFVDLLHCGRPKLDHPSVAAVKI
jgi:hypothetical protein